MSPVRYRTMAITCLLLLACDGPTPTDLPTPGSAPVGAVSTTDAPGTVADLAMTEATDTSVTLTFTEVSDGLGGPASYDVRYAADSVAWGSATPVRRGSCSSPVTGSSVGARKSCTLAGLVASTRYALQLVAFRGTLNLNAVFGALSNVALGATIATPPPVVVTAPGTVNDLSVASVTDTSITLAFTEVSSGAGSPANYDVRYMPKPITWWLAPAVSRGTCSTTVSGLLTGARRTCTVLGLTASTAYEMQLVAFRGTLNQNAVFGSLSNATSGTTAQPAVAWSNEPSGLVTMTDNPFDALDVLGWRTAWNDAGWVTPATDPVRGNVIRWNYPMGFTGGRGPGMEYYDHAPAKEVFAGFWWMASDPWQNHPTQVNKIAFWYSPTWGQNIHMRMYGEPPYRLDVVAEFPSGTVVFAPNANNNPVTLGVWHKIEWHIKYASTGTSGDGVVEWWMDGVLEGRYNNLQSPDDAGFVEYQVSPTWGGLDGVKTENDYFQYDGMHLSRR